MNLSARADTVCSPGAGATSAIVGEFVFGPLGNVEWTTGILPSRAFLRNAATVGRLATQAGVGWQTALLKSSDRKAEVLASTDTGTGAGMGGSAVAALEAAGAADAAGLAEAAALAAAPLATGLAEAEAAAEAAGFADAAAEAATLAAEDAAAGLETAAGGLEATGGLLAGAAPPPQAVRATINPSGRHRLLTRKAACMPPKIAGFAGLVQAGGACTSAAARSRRCSVFSRPSTSIVSVSGGDCVLPVSATRTLMNTSPVFHCRSASSARNASSSAAACHGRNSSMRSRTALSQLGTSSGDAFLGTSSAGS